MKKVVCITEKEFVKAKDIFESAADFKFVPVAFEEEALASTVKKENAFSVVIGVEPYKDELYKALVPCSCIARFGVGHDGVDKVKATQAGLFVTNTPGALDDSVAEHAVWLIGSLTRNIPALNAQTKHGKWQGSIGRELSGKTLLIVGCGQIGSKVAKIAAFGFGMRVVGYDVAAPSSEKMKSFGFSEIARSLDSALKDADFVSIHIPSMPQTRHFVNSAFIEKMKPGSYIVNTARGPVVDENAIFDAIKSGSLGGAGLDVFENEPYAPIDPNKDLRTLQNAVLTPHVGSSTVEACQRMAKRVIENLSACSQKRWSDMDIVNKEVLK